MDPLEVETTSTSRTYRWRGPGCCGCGSGCGSFVLVLLLGGALSLFNIAVSLGFSVQIPLTPSNFTVVGAIGAKEKAVRALPNYAQGSLAGNDNLINHSTTMTVGIAEGVGMLVIGKQPGAPPIDLHVDLR